VVPLSISLFFIIILSIKKIVITFLWGKGTDLGSDGVIKVMMKEWLLRADF